MTEVSFSEIRRLLEILKFNQDNAEYLLKLGEMYVNASYLTYFDLSQPDGIVEAPILDWGAHSIGMFYLINSYKKKPRFAAILPILVALLRIGNYSAAASLAGDALKTMRSLTDDEKRRILHLLLYSLLQKGSAINAINALFYLSQHDMVSASKIVEHLPDEEKNSPSTSFRMVSMRRPIIVEGGLDNKSFLNYCVDIILHDEMEKSLDAYAIQNMEWSFDYCFQKAREFHKYGCLRLAVNMYALAFALDPSNKDAEYNCVVCLNLMSEHELAYQRAENLVNKYSSNDEIYAIGGIAAIIMGNLDTLETMLSIAKKNGINSEILDMLIGYNLERKGQIDQALRHYETSISKYNNFAPYFEGYIRRITFED